MECLFDCCKGIASWNSCTLVGNERATAIENTISDVDHWKLKSILPTIPCVRIAECEFRIVKDQYIAPRDDENEGYYEDPGSFPHLMDIVKHGDHIFGNRYSAEGRKASWWRWWGDSLFTPEALVKRKLKKVKMRNASAQSCVPAMPPHFFHCVLRYPLGFRLSFHYMGMTRQRFWKRKPSRKIILLVTGSLNLSAARGLGTNAANDEGSELQSIGPRQLTVNGSVYTDTAYDTSTYAGTLTFYAPITYSPTGIVLQSTLLTSSAWVSCYHHNNKHKWQHNCYHVA